MEACLDQRHFDCRSAEYDTQTAECRLSSEDRRTRPNDYVDAPQTVEYLENQCLPSKSQQLLCLYIYKSEVLFISHG